MRKIPFHKYQATGNDFILIDNRKNIFPVGDLQLVSRLCHRRFGIGSDGLILINDHDLSDFDMIFYNPDGSQSLCGNGSRCAVNFAKYLGLIDNSTMFNAYDGKHNATIKDGIVSLEMKDVQNVRLLSDGMFLDTGSPHYTQFIAEAKSFNVVAEGQKIRYGGLFHKEGVNVNFIQVISKDEIFVRTYERGVEDETLSCGTGVTASAIAAGFKGVKNKVKINTLGGELNVSYSKKSDTEFENIVLSGPAVEVYKGEIDI